MLTSAKIVLIQPRTRILIKLATVEFFDISLAGVYFTSVLITAFYHARGVARARGGTDARHPQCYVPMRAEPAAAAPVRRRSDSVGDQGTQKAKKPKGKAACKKKSKPE